MEEKKKSTCKKCKKDKSECECKAMRRGYYGLGDQTHDNDDMSPEIGGEMGADGGMSEAIKMPRAPQDSDRSMKGISPEKKKKKLDDFRASADDAKKRQNDQKRKDELYIQRKKKGVKFYDSKGSGYIRDGKKHYD